MERAYEPKKQRRKKTRNKEKALPPSAALRFVATLQSSVPPKGATIPKTETIYSDLLESFNCRCRKGIIVVDQILSRRSGTCVIRSARIALRLYARDLMPRLKRKIPHKTDVLLHYHFTFPLPISPFFFGKVPPKKVDRYLPRGTW